MDEMLTHYSEKMDKTVAHLKSDFAAIRAGRANAAVLDKLNVDYYGTPTPINQMAAVSVAEARVLVIQPWDASTIKAIEKAIQTSDIGINPQNDGKLIRLVFPALTEERRKDIAKEIKKLGEEAKVALRAIRRDAVEKFKKQQKAAELTEDDLKSLESDIQKLTDSKSTEIDETMKSKEKEIMEI